MFGFLNRFKEEIQYRIFLYAHVPLFFMLFYYLWTVVTFSHLWLFVVMNCLLVCHGLLHIFATRWKSNVFRSVDSFVLILSAALLGVLNLLLVGAYK